MRRLVRKFAKSERGAAIVELALVAPVLALMVLVSFGVWDAASRRQNMRAGLDAAALYYMQGGADDTVAKTAALSSWASKPTGATITTARECKCGAAAGTCNVLCGGIKAPSVFVNFVATGTTTGAVFAPTIVEERTIRVR